MEDSHEHTDPAANTEDAPRGSRLFSIGPRGRLAINVLLHLTLFVVSLLLAYVVRYDAGEIGRNYRNWFFNSFAVWLPWFVLLKMAIFGWMGLFRGGWQYSSIRDILNILIASWLFVLITFLLVYVYEVLPIEETFGTIPYLSPLLESYQKGVLVLDFMATVFLLSAARLAFRIYREEMRPVSSEGVRRVMVVGAGDAGEAVIREILRMPVERYRVVGIVDDDPRKRHMTCHGVPVLGQVKDIHRLVEEQEIDEIIIAIPSASLQEKQRVIQECTGTKVQFKTLPGVGDLIDGRVTVSQIRPVDINDLLGREAVELDAEAVQRFIKGRNVLVTGAGGSIGSEMCRQICKYQPRRLVLVEQAETPLFDVENELRKAHPGLEIHPCICDIYDRSRVFSVWRQQRPDVVIHAAAHKHVPMMERNSCEAVKNNILGSRNVADASCECGAAEFVTISTDKAVNPSSVMGASKRVAEIYTQSLNGREGCATQFKAVRFGNVLGSAGSVVPTFKRQIAAGGPVTVTDPRMTRYFMTIPEAAQLVLQAAATGGGGQIFLLDMGEPVKIVDLARQMITLSGFVPGQDIAIEFTGTRPGEKLFEELRTAGEDVEPTVHPKVVVWKSRQYDFERVRGAMERFEELENCPDRDTIVQAIQDLVPEYLPPEPTPAGAEPSAEPAAGDNAPPSSSRAAS